MDKAFLHFCISGLISVCRDEKVRETDLLHTQISMVLSDGTWLTTDLCTKKHKCRCSCLTDLK